MSSEINIRQLLYYKSLNPNPSQQSLRVVKTMQHRLNKLRSTAQSDFRLTTLQTQTPANNFRYGFNVDEHQNQNSQIHFLEVYEHPMKHLNVIKYQFRVTLQRVKRIYSRLRVVSIQSYILTIAQLRDQANRIRLEKSTITSKYEFELNQLQTNFRESMNQKYKLLKEDNVQFIEEQYKLSKEYSRLVKAKQLMEEKQQQLLKRVVQLENTLQGVWYLHIRFSQKGVINQLFSNYYKQIELYWVKLQDLTQNCKYQILYKLYQNIFDIHIQNHLCKYHNA